MIAAKKHKYQLWRQTQKAQRERKRETHESPFICLSVYVVRNLFERAKH